jgi:N-ethylmaleimide reductase
MTDLFTPLQLGPLSLPNRIIMAPLTRGRATADGVPTPPMAQYYSDRASAGLIIAEATPVSKQGRGWLNCPGIYTDEQAAAWKPIVQAVHEKGGRIFLQLWHMGRVVHPDFLSGELPVSSSAVKAEGEVRVPDGTKKPHVTPRALNADELPAIVQDFAQAARRAKHAGFDGVEIHGANGYLIDQFLRDRVNQRTDDFGGSIENRWRFPLMIVDAVIQQIGAERTGMRLSPIASYNTMGDSNPQALCAYGAQALQKRGLAYIHLVDPVPGHFLDAGLGPIHPVFREHYSGMLMVCGGYDKQSGNALLQSGAVDAIVYGRPFIANPDLVERFRSDAPLNIPNPDTFYTPGEPGYNDYAKLVR